MNAENNEYRTAALKECYNILQSRTTGESENAYRWRVAEKPLKKWALSRTGLTVELADKPLHTLDAIQRQMMRASIQSTIDKMKVLQSVLVGGAK